MYSDRVSRGRSAVNWRIYDYCMKRHGQPGRRPRSLKTIVLALCMLVTGCALSIGATNSPPPPNDCRGAQRAPGCP